MKELFHVLVLCGPAGADAHHVAAVSADVHVVGAAVTVVAAAVGVGVIILLTAGGLAGRYVGIGTDGGIACGLGGARSC